MNVKNKVALITGAGSGIGRAIACSLAKRGCHLALSDIRAKGLEGTAALVRKYGINMSTHLVDVADPDAVKNLPLKIMEAHGSIDLLINNAGIAAGGSFLQISEENFERVMEVNFHAVVRLTRTFLPHLLNRQEARIVNMSSLYGLVSPADQTAYSASKFAVRGFSNSLRAELEGSTVGISVVHPGGVATNIAKTALVPGGISKEEVKKRIEKEQKLLTLPAEKAGEIIVKGIEKNKARIIVGSDAKLIALIERLFPVNYWKLLKKLTEIRS